MRVSKREKETLHSWSCFTTRQRIFDDLAVSTSHPPKNQGRVTEWSRAAEKSRPLLYTLLSSTPHSRTLAARGLIWPFWRLYNLNRFVFIRCRERKRWPPHVPYLTSVVSMSNAKPVVCLFVVVARVLFCVVRGWIFTNRMIIFSFCTLTLPHDVPWPFDVIYLVETGFHGHVYYYSILIRWVRTAVDRTVPQHEPFRGKEVYPIPPEKKNFGQVWALPDTTRSIFFHCRLE